MKFLSFLIIVLLPHLNAQPDSTKWKQYSRIGSVSVDSTNGVFGFFRLNRKTDITYKDLRLFTYGIQNQSSNAALLLRIICKYKKYRKDYKYKK